VQLGSFTVLAVTGIPQKFAPGWFAEWMIDVMGGIENTRNIHRVFATILMLAVVYHYAKAGYQKWVLRTPKAMIPGRDDLRAGAQMMRYVLGRSDERPAQGRFTFEEKLEYWSLVWGTVLMIITGFMLWNPIATAGIFPGQFIPAAKAAHGGEAILAVLAILVWHMYHVHIRSFNTSIFTGYMSREEMEHEHALELARIDAGTAGPQATPEEIARRRPGYLMIAGGVVCFFLAGIYYFVTFESTAIATIEPIESARVFVPLPPATEPSTTTRPEGTSTTLPSGGLTWDGVVAGLMSTSCGACHSSGNPIGGLDVSSYEAALVGGNSGPGIVPGDTAGSQIFSIQSSGGHPGQFDAEELALIEEWITAGATETVGSGTTAAATTTGATTTTAGTTTTMAAGEATWNDVFATLFTERCSACHGSSVALGGLDLSTYETAVAGGNGGPGIVPGDADGSRIDIVQSAGGHAGQLTADELAAVREWISAGADEG
jgi:cytochrome b subunit of formate dehydrogenase/cytochrome c5